MDAATLWLSPGYRSEPNAREFAEYLDEHSQLSRADLQDFGDYPWDAPVPPRSEWSTAVSEMDGSYGIA